MARSKPLIRLAKSGDNVINTSTHPGNTGSWRASVTLAVETAHQNLIMVEETIEELNAALALGQPAQAAPAPDPQAKSARSRTNAPPRPGRLQRSPS